MANKGVSNNKRGNSVGVIASALHVEGPGFKSLFLHCVVFFVLAAHVLFFLLFTYSFFYKEKSTQYARNLGR